MCCECLPLCVCVCVCMLLTGDSDSGMLLTDPTAVADSRRGKTRTSINAKQLEILQATYEKEPRPSRVMREEIAAQTGLSLKVIQVWFQNRRSKDKKDVTKGDPGSALSVKSELGMLFDPINIH